MRHKEYTIKFNRDEFKKVLKPYGISNVDDIGKLFGVTRRAVHVWLELEELPIDRYFQLLEFLGVLDTEVIDGMGSCISARLFRIDSQDEMVF